MSEHADVDQFISDLESLRTRVFQGEDVKAEVSAVFDRAIALATELKEARDNQYGNSMF